MRKALIALVSILGLVRGATAEVRLVGPSHSPNAKLVASHRGPWSPVGRIDSTCLNPEGDLTGDGAPVVARLQNRVLIAWTSGSQETVRLALGGATWRLLPPLAITSPCTQPAVAALNGGGALVAWSYPDLHVTRLVFLTRDGLLHAEQDVDGDLLGVSAQGDTLHVVTLNRAVTLTTFLLHYPSPDPIPFLRVGSWTILGGSSLAPTAAPQLRALDANIEFTSSPDTTILSWWSSDRELSYVELTPDGPVFPVETITAHGNGTSRPASLRREALKLVEDR